MVPVIRIIQISVTDNSLQRIRASGKKNLQEKILAIQKYISSDCYQELELKGSIFFFFLEIE